MRARTWLPILVSLAFSQSIFGQVPSSANLFPLYLKVQLDRSVKLSSLKPGDVVEGNLARDVYSADRRILPSGSHARLTVDHVERRRKAASNRWPWAVRIFAPRYEKFPFFKEAAVSTPEGTESLLRVSVISAGNRAEVHAQSSKRPKRDEEKDAMMSAAAADLSGRADTQSSRDRSQRSLGLIMSLEARQEGNDAAVGKGEHVNASSARAITLPAGTACRVLLLNRVSASKSRAGDAVQARLLEPVVMGEDMALPVGSLFEGAVLKAKPPRWLSRAGSLSFTFSRVILPDGAWFPMSASLTGVEINRGSHTRIDAEGRLQGDRPGFAWMLINGGVTAGLAKETDDGTQLLIEAILSSATDASTAGTARIAGTVVSGIFMLTRHGRDVILPDFTDMNITLTRPLTLSLQATSSLRLPNR